MKRQILTSSEYSERVARFTALTALTPAITQTAAQAFQAAMWTFTVIDNTRSAS